MWSSRGAAEVRIHLVTGARPGTAVRHTGWAAGEGLRSELLPLHGLAAAPALPPVRTAFTGRAVAPALAGETTDRAGGDLFVCLARLTAADGPALDALATVAVDGRQVTVTWPDGTVQRARVSPGEVIVESPPPGAR